MKRVLLLLISVFFIAGTYLYAQAEQPDTIVNKEVHITKEALSQAVKDSILYSKLSADQLLDLKNQEEMTERQRIDSENRNDMPLNGFGIFMIVLLPFLFITIVLIITGRIRNRESQRKHDLYMKSLEMGQAIPDHFFDEPKKPNTISNLKKGILWLSVGLGALVYFTIINEEEALILGIVPAFIGAGYLLVHFLEKPKNADEQNG